MKKKLARRFLDFYDAWQFLKNHPMFRYKGESMFHRCLTVDVVKLNPRTERVEYTKRGEEDHRRNTETCVWLECGAYMRPEEFTEEERKSRPHGDPSYDSGLNCGGATFEEAILALSDLVLDQYGRRSRTSHRRWKTEEDKAIAASRKEMEAALKRGEKLMTGEDFLAKLKRRRRKHGKRT